MHQKHYRVKPCKASVSAELRGNYFGGSLPSKTRIQRSVCQPVSPVISDTHIHSYTPSPHVCCVFPVTWSLVCAHCQSLKSPALVLSPSHLRSLCTLAGIPSSPPLRGAPGCLWTGRRWRDLQPRPGTPASSDARSPAAWRGSSRWAYNTANPASLHFLRPWFSNACRIRNKCFKSCNSWRLRSLLRIRCTCLYWKDMLVIFILISSLKRCSPVSWKNLWDIFS